MGSPRRTPPFTGTDGPSAQPPRLSRGACTIAAARTLQLSHVDHPPLHVWLAHAASAVFGETRWIRLPFVLLFSATGGLRVVLTRWFYGERAALWALQFSTEVM